MPNKILQLAARTSSGTFIVLIVILSRLIGLLEPLELFYFDLILKARQSEPQDSRIVLIEINSAEPFTDKRSKLSPQKLTDLITQIQTYEPAVIGFSILRDLIDESDPSFEGLSDLIVQKDNIISAESFIPPFIYPLPNTSTEKVGFVNLFPDSDNFTRRALLASPDFQNPEEFKFSFSLLLAKHYLEKKGLTLNNGKADQAAMRFGSTEIPKVYSNTGGYHRIDAAGVQTLVNYRNARVPFKVIRLTNTSSTLDSQLLKDKIIIVGVTDSNKRAYVKTPVDKQMSGLKLNAHFTSQITGAVLDGRPLIRSLNEIYEYIFIALFAIPTIWIWRRRTSLLTAIVTESSILFLLFSISYLLLVVYGYWLIVVPQTLILLLNLVVYLSSIYRDEMRRKVIGRTFDILHNGPLQSLAIILNDLRSEEMTTSHLECRLRELSQDIREIGDALRGESLSYEQSLLLNSSTGNILNLNNDLHKLFYQIYSATLQRDFQNFKDIKTKIRSFEAVPVSKNNFSLKRDICRYLEEAMCNVGRHAVSPTRLIVTGKNYEGLYILTVEDNGSIESNEGVEPGQGTKNAMRLAKKLKGEFKRERMLPRGTICQLKWKP